jgi:hypothetical protein
MNLLTKQAHPRAGRLARRGNGTVTIHPVSVGCPWWPDLKCRAAGLAVSTKVELPSGILGSGQRHAAPTSGARNEANGTAASDHKSDRIGPPDGPCDGLWPTAPPLPSPAVEGLYLPDTRRSWSAGRGGARLTGRGV